MFFPIKDRNPTIHFPAVTIALIGANLAVFIYELMLGPQLSSFVASYGATPYEIVRNTDLIGRYAGVPIIHTPGPPIIHLTLFTSMFLHGSFFHIFGNMLFLWIFGNNVEDILGSFRFLLFYLVCGLIASLTHIAFQPNSPIPTVGASGAVAGVLGAYLIAFPRARVLTLVFLGIFIRLVELPAAFLLVFWFVLQAFSGIASLSTGLSQGGVAWFAHIGGFVAGAMYLKLTLGRRYSRG
ncbi:MAG: rhomboid family intramembrane serine protease [Candidatus Latescibacteria bacterium]|nr:rhomboid family intramembrane serine protease [Candidatus Latescibacterota bacterium]NIM21988.1 rhomboid family intramembrane serine protease [Candidatus Latescibacterota bacterium]NIM66006.1 rhomboid family intramembrane serine protease [Candidatus Latescibacterota bacterium]NIO02414.1 rhomboid family intramembrane serine protease [Candidatus Latescibacterota bacterium]NIO29325.1 rhomboid family intramembrane serine protease [Candidatus Latescibacterota bacterium]